MPIHALLIGINRYHPASAVTSLSGCHNDVQAVSDFLLDHYKDQHLIIKTLLDEQADRQNVIAAFRDHLCLAGPDDTVFVYYSGHGSQNITAPEFQRFVPDMQEEGWVLYDSRLPGRYDLADKEIALLLEQVGSRNPDIVVIADSCHSGSVTRSSEDFLGWKPRYISGSKEPRPLASYLEGAYQKRLAQQGVLNVPATRHILFSACDNKEVAWESDEKCGVFTKALLSVLRDTGGRVRYADVYTRACASIRVLTRQQNPQTEAFGGFNPRSGFLGKSVPVGLQRRYALYFHQEHHAWRIKLGAADGVRTDTDTAIPVRIFDAETNGNESGTGYLSYVGATESGLDAGDDLGLNPYKTYWGEPLSVPLAPLLVYCPNRTEVKPVEEALSRQQETAILFSDLPDACPVELRAEDGNLVLYHTGRNALIHGVEGTTEAAVAYMLETLDHLAHWRRIQDLHNPRTGMSQTAVALALEVQRAGAWTPLPEEAVTLSFRGERINFRLDVSNRSGQPLYMALVYLNPRFQMSVLWHSTIPVPAGNEGLRTFENYFFLPPGIDEELDTLKLVVSTEPIEQTAFSRPELLPRIVGPTRSIGGFRSIGSLSHPDWFTKTIRIRLLRDSSDGIVGERPLTLAGGQITINAHPMFRSAYTLSAPAASRGLDVVQLDRAFFQQNPQVELLALGSIRGAGTPFLDLTGIEADGQLEQQPLEINLAPADPDSLVMPFWFDGENFLPVGESVVQADGSMQIQVRNIPEEAQAIRTRSLGKALRLFCFKFAKDYGLPLNTQHLKWVEYRPDGSPERKSDEVAAKIAAARKIVLLIHGIIGDTGYMAKAFSGLAAQPEVLILTFDYENLNTPIEDTALALKNMLLKTGIGSDDSKELIVVAQSMGGLVARYLIEHLDGHRFTDKLILTGTPSAGAKLGNVADYVNWATTMMGLGLRYFSWSLPALAGFVGALQFAKDKLFVTLEQLKPGSEFLSRLAAGSPPSIPYHVVAGNIYEFLEQEKDPNFMVKVLAQTGRLFYGDEPNDGAVSVESICAAPGATKELVAGHHYGYYVKELKSISFTG
ncbi:MAG TPA: caspase family protein [Saprospiraceae bacterium]|nr:caspase family protein [Saprospiraceae bacterium]